MTWRREQLYAIAAVLVSLLIGAGLASHRGPQVLVLFGAALVLALALWLPPHLFLGASVAVLGSSSAFEQHPFRAGSISVYASDLMLVLLLVRAVSPRERHSTLRIMEPSVAVPFVLWAAVMLLAGARGHFAGNSPGAVARLEMPLAWLTLFTWGFMRVLSESAALIPRIVRVLCVTSLGFIAYAVLTRITHHRFEPPAGTGVGAVDTTAGVLRRDYGLFSAFDVYPLLALGGLAFLVFSRRASKSAMIVTFVALAATLFTLVRGFIFGLVAGATALVVLSLKERWNVRLSARLLPLLALLIVATIPFAVLSPTAARGVAERVLPGILAQAQGANENAQFREQVLAAGVHVARQKPLGLGFVSPDAMTSAGYPPLYAPHSQWGSLLAFTGWPGLLLFVWLGIAIIRRSSRLPAATPWLHPLIVATALLLFVQGFGWDVMFSQVSSLGLFALVLALRFGLNPEPSERLDGGL